MTATLAGVTALEDVVASRKARTGSCTHTLSAVLYWWLRHRMDVQECLAEVKLPLWHQSNDTCESTPSGLQVKLCAGKDVYKGIFLPLLRVYRQNQDVEKLTRGNLVT